MAKVTAIPPVERVLRRAEQLDNGCWQYHGAIRYDGYGQITIGSRIGEDRRRGTVAHRVVYEALVGPIPAGLAIDHLCRNRACVNPSHMEAVTAKENVRRSLPFRTGYSGHKLTKADRRERSHGSPLTPREATVLATMAEVGTRAKAAVVLGLTENTVRWYLRRAYARLGVHSVPEAVALQSRPGSNA